MRNIVDLAWLIFIFIIIGLFAFANVYAEPTQVQDYVQCTYKPSQSDEVIVHCGSLKGKGSVSVRICGINYSIDLDCK